MLIIILYVLGENRFHAVPCLTAIDVRHSPTAFAVLFWGCSRLFLQVSLTG